MFYLSCIRLQHLYHMDHQTTTFRNIYACKSIVFNNTISKNVPGALSNPNESRVCKVGRHKVLIFRKAKLDYYGNPVHVATYINSDGTPGVTYQSNGGSQHAVRGLFNKKGISVKYDDKIAKKMKANSLLNDYVKRIAREDSGW